MLPANRQIFMYAAALLNADKLSMFFPMDVCKKLKRLKEILN